MPFSNSKRVAFPKSRNHWNNIINETKSQDEKRAGPASKKRYWYFVNRVITNSTKSSFPPLNHSDGSIPIDTLDKAEGFASFFATQSLKFLLFFMIQGDIYTNILFEERWLQLMNVLNSKVNEITFSTFNISSNQ